MELRHSGEKQAWHVPHVREVLDAARAAGLTSGDVEDITTYHAGSTRLRFEILKHPDATRSERERSRKVIVDRRQVEDADKKVFLLDKVGDAYRRWWELERRRRCLARLKEEDALPDWAIHAPLLARLISAWKRMAPRDMMLHDHEDMHVRTSPTYDAITAITIGDGDAQFHAAAREMTVTLPQRLPETVLQRCIGRPMADIASHPLLALGRLLVHTACVDQDGRTRLSAAPHWTLMGDPE